MTEKSEQTGEWRQRFLGQGDLASGSARLGERPLGSADDSVRQVYQRTDAPDAKGSSWELTRRVTRRKITCDASIAAEAFVAERVDGTESTTLYFTSPSSEVGDRVFVESEPISECQENYEAVRMRSDLE
jgi:hypothetical protein